MPKTWCKYWLPFQWILFLMKRCYFVKKIGTKRTKQMFEASLFQDKYAYLHLVREVSGKRELLFNTNKQFSVDGLSCSDGRFVGL